MAEILVLVDHLDGTPKKVTLELLTLARSLGEPSAVFVGAGFDTAKAALAEYGAQKVYVAGDAELDSYLVAPKAEVLAQLVEQVSPAAVLIPSGPEGKEVAASPRGQGRLRRDHRRGRRGGRLGRAAVDLRWRVHCRVHGHQGDTDHHGPARTAPLPSPLPARRPRSR